jgi:hypothetical protein
LPNPALSKSTAPDYFSYFPYSLPDSKTIPHDIFKKDAAGRMVWSEAAKDLQSAKTLARKLSRCNKGKFVVFDRRKQQVVANFQRARGEG